MAKKRRSGSRKEKKLQRDASRIADHRRKMLELNQELYQEDARYYPQDDRPREFPTGRHAEIRVARRTKTGRPYKSIMTVRNQFESPWRTIICRRRSVRRQILFRLGFLGKGKGGAKKNRRLTFRSLIRC